MKKLSTPHITICIILLGILVYFPTFFNGFVADDNVYILTNPQIINFHLSSFFLGSSYYSGDVTQLSGIYYKPFFTLITSLLFNLSSGTPFLIHLVQLTIHITNAILIFLFFKNFFNKTLSFFLSLLFLVHPGNVESVVYIADLQDVLFFFFGILALLLTPSQNNFTPKRLFGVSSLLLSSLLSKESGILFLPTFLALVLLTNKKQFFKSSLATITIFILYLFLRFAVANVTVNHQAIAPIMKASVIIKLLTMPKIIYSYLKLFLFPYTLSWGQHWLVTSPNLKDFYFPILVLFFFIITTTFSYFKNHSPKNKNLILFFSFLTLIGIGLHLQIIPLDFTFAERWAYFPIFALLGLLGVFVNEIKLKNRNYNLVIIAIFLLIVAFSIRSTFRITNWNNDFSLASHDIQIDPNSFALQNNLGYELIKKQQYEQAKEHLQKAIDLFPDHSNNSAYNNLAFTYSKLNNPQKSIEIYHQALSLGDFYITYQNYIAELIRQNKYDLAKVVLNQALSKYPNNPKLYLLAAVIEYNTNQDDLAISALQKAHQLSPGIANNLYSKMKNKEPITL